MSPALVRGHVPWWRSIRLSIALAASAVTIVVLTCAGLVVDHQARADGRERLREQTLDRLGTAANVYRWNGGILTNGATLSESLPPKELLAAVSGSGARASYYDGQWMWASNRVGRNIVLTVRLPADDLHAQTRALRMSMATTGILGILASAGFGWLAASGISRRLRRGARAASQVGASVSADGAGVRASVGGHDEVTALTAAVDQMAADLAERIQRERQFGADVAHELRTPLTALVSASELLPDDEVGGLVRTQVNRLRTLVLDLLELFRAESGQSESQLVTVNLADAAVAALSASTDPPEIRREAPSVVAVDPRRLERILTNLVTNARLHGDGEVEVSVRGHQLVLRDHGPGFPEAILERGPRRFQRHSGQPGSGLGLAICKAQADAMGVEMDLSNHPDGGAQVLLRWQPVTSQDPEA